MTQPDEPSITRPAGGGQPSSTARGRSGRHALAAAAALVSLVCCSCRSVVPGPTSRLNPAERADSWAADATASRPVAAGRDQVPPATGDTTAIVRANDDQPRDWPARPQSSGQSRLFRVAGQSQSEHRQKESRQLNAAAPIAAAAELSASQPPPPHRPPYPTLPPDAVYGPPVGQDDLWAPPGIPAPWPADEYVFDGGDQDVSVQIGKDFSVRGLNLEDTVGHFDTLDGRTIVAPSNRVPIYAPRFAAVRKVYGVVLHEGQQHVEAVDLPVGPVRHRHADIATTTLQQLQPAAEAGRKQTSAFRQRTRDLLAENLRGLLGFNNTLAAYEDFQIIRHGQFDQSEKARLAKAIDAALVWEDKQAVQVLVDGKRAAVERGFRRPQDTLRYDPPPARPRLRIVKVASKSEAQPGDVIDFTIRFDNTGNQLIGNVTVLDNLSARLQYVPGSAQCSVKADFFTQENEAGSQVLRWEIIDPLKPNQGGIIRFRCRVR